MIVPEPIACAAMNTIMQTSTIMLADPSSREASSLACSATAFTSAGGSSAGIDTRAPL